MVAPPARRAGDPLPLTVDLDTGNIGSYDYPLAPWFDVPYRTGRRVVVGPYVDYAGTDEYILTFAAPISSDAGFFGVAAADIRTNDFERAMLPTLNSEGPATVLVNATGRVLASNTPAIIVGSMVHPGGTRQELPARRGLGRLRRPAVVSRARLGVRRNHRLHYGIAPRPFATNGEVG